MKNEDIIKTLNYFQSNAFKTYKSLGFGADNANIIFGIIIEMRNLVTAAEAEDTILLHKYMGECANYIANYAVVHSLKLSEVLTKKSHSEMAEATDLVDLEYYLEKIKDDLGFVKDMQENEKIEFIQKCWICTFPEEYHDDFIKTDRILRANIEDNKVKYPQAFTK
jgi:hypothetical protein